MIRLLFAMFVTLAGFAAVALWTAHGGDAREVAEEIFPAEMRKEMRSAVDRFDLEDVASRLPDGATSRLPDAVASRLPDSVTSRLPDAVASRLPDSVAKEEAPDDPNDAADGGEAPEPEKAEVAEEAEIAEEEVEERDLSPRAELARDLGAADDDGAGDEDGEVTATAVAARARIWSDRDAPLREPDQDAWASLIRRMLAVYQRTGEVE